MCAPERLSAAPTPGGWTPFFVSGWVAADRSCPVTAAALFSRRLAVAPGRRRRAPSRPPARAVGGRQRRLGPPL
eukprot:scaffold2674_cov333-Prasinococcus_capsulatus_cf.AAC.10